MKSTSGEYYIALDHGRGLAAFMVFAWHFIHANNGHLAGPPVFPLSVFAEGHTGVALFMTLSGYLFAKLIADRAVDFRRFLLNRAIRLLPLLGVVVVLVGVRRWLSGADLVAYAWAVVGGVIGPSLPNGGWSITTEFHFYLLFPVLLAASRRWRWALPMVLVAALGVRALVYAWSGEVHRLAYGTIAGRIDQFLLGMIAFSFRREILALGHWGAGVVAVGFLAAWWAFDAAGGFYLQPSYPSPSPVWIVLPTLEGLAYATMICWYDGAVRPTVGPVSRFFASIGTWSYSIYLLHFFLVFELSGWVHRSLVSLDSLELAIAMAIPAFLVTLPVGWLGYRLIERPFLGFRVRYLR